MATKIKSPRRKSVKARKSSAKRKAVKSARKSQHKAQPYQVGSSQILSIQYNGIGQEFVFALTNNKGKIGSTFHVKSDILLGSMQNPLMVNSI